MMDRSRFRLAGVATVALLLAAGCPIESATDATTRTVPTGSGRAPSGDDSGLVGPPATTGTDAGTGTGGPVAVGGDSSSTSAAPDALSISFPECNRPAQADFWQAEVLRLVNQARAAQQLPAVTWNATLASQAEQYACEMIHYGFFAHVNPANGSHLRDRAAEFGYEYWIIGENLAAGQQSPVEAVQAWLNSPCHRENILNPAFTELGVGIRFGGSYGYYWVQEFGRPFSIEPYPGPPHADPECQQPG